MPSPAEEWVQPLMVEITVQFGHLGSDILRDTEPLAWLGLDFVYIVWVVKDLELHSTQEGGTVIPIGAEPHAK